MSSDVAVVYADDAACAKVGSELGASGSLESEANLLLHPELCQGGAEALWRTGVGGASYCGLKVGR